MPKCHNFYPNCQRTGTHFRPDQALGTILSTKVYWSCSTSIVRVCFSPLLPPTLKRDLKRKSNFQINVNPLAVASFYELLCYHSLKHLDPIMDEIPTFIHCTLSSLHSFPTISTVIPEATDGNFNNPWILRCILHTNFGMFNPRANESFPPRGLVKT